MKKVLVVDNSSFMRVLVKKIIQKNGYETIFEASDKGEAMELFNVEKPEIVFLDLNMSEYTMDGIDVLTEMMKIAPETAVFMVSAVGHENVKDECIALGAKSYIKKPFDADDILKALETCK